LCLDLAEVKLPGRAQTLGKQLFKFNINPAVSGRFEIGNIIGNRFLAKSLSLYAGINKVHYIFCFGHQQFPNIYTQTLSVK
jgi:hypothetical protein